MSTLNQVNLIGYLGADPEIRYTAGNEPVANFRIATTERFTNKTTGDRREITEWHRIVAFNRLAEIAGDYLHKGSRVYLRGRLRTRKWQGQDGQDRYTVEILADQLVMLDSRPHDAGDAGDGDPAEEQGGGSQHHGQGQFDYPEDEIPY